MKKRAGVLIMAFLIAFSMALASAPEAQAKDLPKLISITTFKVGSLGYTITSAFREAVEKYTPMKVRVEPYGTEVARMLPLRRKEAELTLSPGPNAVSASYGLGNFATKKWGPQPLRIVWRGMTLHVGCFVRADSGINSLKDLKGKKVPVVPGSAAYKINFTSHLAFGGLTWKDVTPVTNSSLMGVLEAFLGGKVDVVFIATSVPKLREVFAARHGAKWLPMPFADKAAWQRLQAIAPWNIPTVYKKGIGLKKGQSVEMGSFPFSLYAYEHADPNMIYAFVKAMAKGYKVYSPMHKVLPRWTLKQAVTDPSPLPYHPGAIKYFKEAGVWTPAMDKRQADQLAKFRQRQAAWKAKK